MTPDIFSSGGPAPPAWHANIRRISKHARGWTTLLINGADYKRFEALRRRRALRKAAR